MAYHDRVLVAFILFTTSDVFIARPAGRYKDEDLFKMLETKNIETDNPCKNPFDCATLGDRVIRINNNNNVLHEVFNDLFIGFDLINPDLFAERYHRFRRNAMNEKEWPKSEDGLIYIPYSISDSETNTRVSVNLARAIKEYEKHTCIRLVPWTNQRDYIEIISGGGCYTFPGRIGGRQLMSLPSGCEELSIIIHEFMHVVGFYHEMSRPDRDEHIKMNWTNVEKGLEKQYKIQEGFAHGKEYDIHSIMHYGRTAGGRDSRYDVMTPLKDPDATLGVPIDGSFSPGDILALNLKTLCGVNVTVYGGTYATREGSSLP